MPRAAAEYWIPRVAFAAVRVLDRDVIGQAHHPRGAAGRVTAWEMAHRPSNRRRGAWAVELLDVRPADRVLEIGFGPGEAIAGLVRAGAGHVYGVDHSAVMLRRATRRNAAAIRAGRVTLAQAPVERLPFDGPFTAILAVNTLAFWPAPPTRLTDLRHRLTPDGRIAILTQPRHPGATEDTTRAAAHEIESLLTEAGFAHPDTRYLALDPPAACVLAEPAP